MSNKLSPKKKLLKILEASALDSTSRRLHIYLKNENNQLSNLHFAIADAHVVLCRYGNLNGMAALEILFQQKVEHVYLFDWDADARKHKVLPLMSINNLVYRLFGKSLVSAESKLETLQTGLELLPLAQDILEELYGSEMSEEKIQEIAAKFSPTKQPKLFIDECQNFASMMIGSGVDEQFSALREQFIDL